MSALLGTAKSGRRGLTSRPSKPRGDYGNVSPRRKLELSHIIGFVIIGKRPLSIFDLRGDIIPGGLFVVVA